MGTRCCRRQRSTILNYLQASIYLDGTYLKPLNIMQTVIVSPLRHPETMPRIRIRSLLILATV